MVTERGAPTPVIREGDQQRPGILQGAADPDQRRERPIHPPHGLDVGP